jgi:hypothetical protein
MSVDQADLRNAGVERQNLAHRPQANHVPRMNWIGAAAGACLARIGDLKSGVHERLQHLVGVDETIGGFGSFGGGVGEHRRRAAAQILERQCGTDSLAVGGGGRFGDNVSIHEKSFT